jgi:tetratricopeptide (TPR) repeat protein
MCRRYQRALDELDRLESIDPEHMFVPTLRTWTYWFMGATDKALENANRAAPLLTDSYALLACIGFVYGETGQTAEARDILDRLLASSEHQYVAPFSLAYLYAGFGDFERTFEYLTKSYEDRVPGMVYLAQMADGWFAGISGDPRYRELLDKMNLLDVAPSLGAS